MMRRKEFLKLSGMVLAGSALPGKTVFAGIQGTAAGPARIDVRIYEVQLKYAWTLSRGTWNVRRNVLVRIEKDGTSGMGEAAPIARYNENAEGGLAFIEKARSILEKDLWQYFERWQELDALVPGEHAAKAALDMAILDWVGKKLGVPAYRFFGLDKDKTPPTTYSIGIDEVKVMQEKVQEARDFSVYKIKLGSKDDKAIIDGIREVTGKPLRVDANEGWKTKEEALAMIDWLAGRDVELVEQPMPAGMFEDYKWLKERAKLSLFADESLMKATDIPKIAEGFHGINIKLMKCGGIQEAVRMVAMARAMGLKLMLGCMVETSLGITAGASIAPLFDYADLDGNLLITNDPFKGVQTVKGRLVLGDKPGLGIEGDVWK
jgi:L-alanine-DL-glutamate epimerase-like enolase superfamily enzyme